MTLNTLRGLRAHALVAVAGALSMASAHAALTCSGAASNTPGSFTCTETVSFGPVNTDLSGILTLDKFLPYAAAGFTQTLTAVDWSVKSAMTANGTLTNNALTTQAFTFRETEAVTFSAGAGAPAGFLAGNPVGALDTGLLSFSLAPGASTPYSFSGNSITATGTAANPTAYAGGGTFQALFSTLTDVTLSGGGGNIALVSHTLVTPQLTLKYTFTTAAVPEAPSVVLMALGLAGLAGAMRRKRG